MFLAFIYLTKASLHNGILHKKDFGRKIGKIHNPIVNYEQIPYLPMWKKVGKLERDYSTSDLNSLVDTISNEFHIERNRVQDYFSRSKWASLSKQLFNRIDFDQDSDGLLLLLEQ